MSTSLRFRPHTPIKGEDIYSLKWTLGERYWGTTCPGSSDRMVVGENEVPFLEGIAAGNSGGDMGRDAKKLIDAIRKHGSVELWIGE